MASAVARSGTALANLKKMLAEPSATGARMAYYALSPAAVTAARRLYNTQGKEVRRYDDDDDDLHNCFTHDVFDRLGAPMSLGRLLCLMEEYGVSASRPSGLSSTERRGWSVAKEDDEAVYLKVPMPGLGKEHVKVSAEQNSLVIKGEGEKDAWDVDKEDAAVPRYSGRIEVPADTYKLDKIKAEMKNGVLMVTVPKLKKEEPDVFQVEIE